MWHNGSYAFLCDTAVMFYALPTFCCPAGEELVPSSQTLAKKALLNSGEKKMLSS